MIGKIHYNFTDYGFTGWGRWVGARRGCNVRPDTDFVHPKEDFGYST